MASDEDLLVFGYTSRIYPADERSDFIAEERHLITSPNDPSLRIDRYDVRLLLPAGYDDRSSAADEESCPTEDLEEEMCDEERYRDLTAEPQQSQEEDTRPKKAEIGFDYGTGETKTNGESGDAAGSDDSDSETEPFVPPPGIKLPVGLVVPDNQKQNHIIERTALFVVTKGPQMEIVIKARQRNNMEQFGFLEFDNPLHPYYKYLSKLIREKKYTPSLTKRTKPGAQGDRAGSASPGGTVNSNKEKKPNALTALASQHESDSDSDSDYELHPSLLAGARKGARSPDVIDGTENAAGPRRRPSSPSPPRVTAHRHDYDMSKSNDIYASLFKSLSQVSVEREEAEKRKLEKIEIEKHLAASAPPPPDEEYQAWWLSFYGTPCPFSSPQPMVPPPPDLQPVISSYAEFVARHGAEAELELRERVDLQLTFMHPHSPHFSYYQHQVRLVQWERAKRAAEKAEEPTLTADVVESEGGATTAVEESDLNVVVDDACVPSTSSPLAQDPSAPLLNRKQRRRLQDSFRVATTQPVGIVDPVAAIGLADPFHVPKVSSSPALLPSTSVVQPVVEEGVISGAGAAASVVVQPSRPFPSVPVSFTLAPIREEVPCSLTGTAIAEDSSSAVLVDARTLSPLTVAQPVVTSPHILPPPVPPNILSNTQLDRKEKARIFMERLLNEKRVKKLREQEEARIRELEAQKAELERQLAEEDAKKKKSSLEMVDKLINSRIGALLGRAEAKKSESRSKLPARLSDDEAEKDRDDMRGKRKKEKKEKKEKSKKHKHRKSRSRSRSRSREKEKKRRRHSSDSRSRDRESKKRKKDRR
uniref:SWAP Surp domain containing protein n=2 Tax=Haemonchus contortus TaxID=6289 RepID=A0A7I4YF40_HAECO